MRKVYIMNDGGHNYDDAKRFGQLVFCTDKVIKKSDTAQMYRELCAALEDANNDDFILVSSLASLCCVATAIMVERFGEVHFLLYDNGQYVERDLILNN